MDIITGYLGEAHITAEQDRDINIGIVGDGSYVMPAGQRLAAEVSSNNEVRIRDGVIMHQGCAASIKKNTYDPVTIINGSQGMKRIDLIVARYERNVETGVETISLMALQGTPAEESPEVPEHTEGDIQSGDTVVDMPLYKVQIDGLNITGLEKVFEEIESLKSLNGKISGAAGQIVWCGLLSLLYNRADDMQGTVNDAPPDIYDNPNNYTVQLTMRNVAGTAYAQVDRLTYEIRTSQRVLVVDGWGGGFVSGYVVSVSVTIIKKQ